MRWNSDTEKPERVIGACIRFVEPDGLGREPPELPVAEIRSCADGVYHADFIRAFEFEGQPVRTVQFSARHQGYPVSGVSKRGVLAVNAQLDSGVGFMANLVRASLPA